MLKRVIRSIPVVGITLFSLVAGTAQAQWLPFRNCNSCAPPPVVQNCCPQPVVQCPIPVTQTTYRQVPVTEYRPVNQTVMRPVSETKYVDQQVTAYRQVLEPKRLMFLAPLTKMSRNASRFKKTWVAGSLSANVFHVSLLVNTTTVKT